MSPVRSRRASQAETTDLDAGSDRTEFDAFPELGSIRLLAVDAAICTFAIDAEAEGELVVYLQQVVAAALVAAYAPIAEVARKASRVADGARAAQLAATALTAEVMAMRVAEVAAVLQARDDASATRTAQAASDAAGLMAASVAPGGEGAAASAAAQVAAAVRDAAAAKSQEHAQAAATVAQSAADAAAKVNNTADVAKCCGRAEGVRGGGRRPSHRPRRVLSGCHQCRRHRSGTLLQESVDQPSATIQRCGLTRVQSKPSAPTTAASGIRGDGRSMTHPDKANIAEVPIDCPQDHHRHLRGPRADRALLASHA